MTRVALALWIAGTVVPAGAQSVADACAPMEPAESIRCEDLSRAVHAAQGDLGLLGAGGADLPGAASTLGKRVGAGPRLSLSGRIGVVGFSAPDLTVSGTGPAPARSALAPSLQAAAGLGLFRGFSPSPTVGGVLAVDLLGTGSLLFPPGSLGYEGTEVGYGLGVRVGVFRESFTLPGITLTATQRWVRGVDIGAGPAGAGALSFNVSTTSLRGLVGKDLWGLGFLGGLGWDHSSSNGSLPTPAAGTASFSDTGDSRTLIFGGVSWSYFVVQLSGELGWASGWSGSQSPSGDAYDPSSSRFFGGASVRLIY